MDSNLLENLIALRDNSVQELTEAHDWANQLRAIINEPFSTDRSVEADYLIAKILRSFTETISMLNSGEVTDPVPAKPAGGPMNSASREYRVSGERMKSSPPLPRGHWPKDKRSALGTEIGRRDKREPTPLRKSGIQKNPDRRFFLHMDYILQGRAD